MILYKFLFLHGLTLTLIFSHVVVKASPTIFTCCKFQSILDPRSGECGSTPEYEFEYDIYQPEWTIPNILTNDGKSGITARLVERPPWCKCKAVKIIPLQFRKLDLENGTESWTHANEIRNMRPYSFNESPPTLSTTIMTSDGHLSFGGTRSFISTEQYCLNKLEYINRRIESKLSLEFIHCAESCQNRVVENENLVHSLVIKNKIDWIRTPYCEDLEESEAHLTQQIARSKNASYPSNEAESIHPLCKKWTPFYYKDDNFFLIVSSQNVTTSIQDSTYPWATLTSLFPHTFCKTRGSSSSSTTTTNKEFILDPADNLDDDDEGKLVKFCLTEITEIFYDHKKLYAILAGVSAIMLLFNLAIYFSLRKNLSISGWTEFLYSLSLYAYFGFSIVGLLTLPEDPKFGSLCYTIGALIQYFELANGATLVALSFDIFWTFCKFDSDGYTDDPKVSRVRLSLYIAFTIFTPLSIVVFGLLRNESFSITAPHYGVLHCLAPSWALSSYIQFGMQGLNLVLALISAYIILNKKNQRAPRIFKFDNVDEEHILDPDRLDIFSKLLLFVFAFWLLNFLEFFYSGEIFPLKPHLIGFHLANYSQGIFAFFILICNRRTLRGLFQRDWNLKNLFRHACCMSGNCGRREVNPATGDENPEEALPLSPLMKKMKTGSIKRSTVRGNAFY